jgi:hypothetical protein
MIQNDIVFEHQGGPFELDHVAALITGGSAKPYESPVITGRNGTGFLVTHALSTDVVAEGQMISSGEVQPFRVSLRRHGTIPAEIVEGIRQAIKELNQPPTDPVPSGRFRYRFDWEPAKEVAREGLAYLIRLAPYAFAFSPQLASVTITGETENVHWERSGEMVTEDGDQQLIKIALRRNEAAYSVLCLRSRMPACISVAAVLTWDNGGQRAIVRPLSGDPCLYLRFPLIAPHDIGLPVPIDGPFAVDENRTTVFIGGETKEGVANESLIDRGLELMPQLISYLASDGVSGVRYLMRIPRWAEGEDLQWWDPKLARLAYTLSNLPAVPTHQGELLPARSAAFVVGRVVVDDPVPSVDITAVWNLLRALHLPVPRLEEAKDWEKTVLEWRALEVDVPLYSVASIVEIVRGTRTLAGLEDKLKMDESGAIAWLRSLLDLLATATPNPDALLDGCCGLIETDTSERVIR